MWCELVFVSWFLQYKQFLLIAFLKKFFFFTSGTLTIVANVYITWLFNFIRPEIEKIPWKNQNGFRKNPSTASQILTIRRIFKRVRTKNLEVTLVLVDFCKAFDSIHRGKMEEIQLAYNLFKEIDFLQKHRSNGLLTWWRHRLLWHCQ